MTEASVQTDPSARWKVIAGRFAVGLGVLGVVRLVPEMMVFGFPGTGIYNHVCLVDVLLSVLSIFGGVRIVKRLSRGSSIICAVAGAQVVTSIMWLVKLFPGITFASRNYGDAELGIRCVFYAISIIVWPYVCIRLIGGASSRSHPNALPERFELLLSSVVSAVAAFFLNALIIWWD